MNQIVRSCLTTVKMSLNYDVAADDYHKILLSATKLDNYSCAVLFPVLANYHRGICYFSDKGRVL